jgi:hypothetical protein
MKIRFLTFPWFKNIFRFNILVLKSRHITLGGHMLYITGPSDTLKELKEKEGFVGDLQMYEALFAKANPELVAKFPGYRMRLPPHIPVYLVTAQPSLLARNSEALRTLFEFSPKERQMLRQMQEERYEDISTYIALSDIMEELQTYAKDFRKALKTPLMATPWEDFNNSLTNKHLFKIFGETSRSTSDIINKSVSFRFREQLYENMMTRDALSREWHSLRDQHDKVAKSYKQNLKRKIDELTQVIRQQLPKKIQNAKLKYLHKQFSEAEIRKMRSTIETPRAAGKMKLLTTNLDVLNKTGVGRLRTAMNELKMLGDGVNKGTKWLNWGAVAYDTVEAYFKNGKMARAFLAGAASVVIGSKITAGAGGTTVLGGYFIGALASYPVLGEMIPVLVCTPVVGWVVLFVACVVGVAVGGFISYKTKGAVEGIWDLAENATEKIAIESYKAIDWMHQKFISGWDANKKWIPEFYGDKKKESCR